MTNDEIAIVFAEKVESWFDNGAWKFGWIRVWGWGNDLHKFSNCTAQARSLLEDDQIFC